MYEGITPDGHKTFWLDREDKERAIEAMRGALAEHGYTSRIKTADLRKYVDCFLKACNNSVDEWEPMFMTNLYISHGCEYCMLQEFLFEEYAPTKEIAQKAREEKERIRTMKKAYIVNYRRYDDSPSCTNLVVARSKERVEKKYSDCEWSFVQEAKEYEVDQLITRGCPLVILE